MIPKNLFLLTFALIFIVGLSTAQAQNNVSNNTPQNLSEDSVFPSIDVEPVRIRNFYEADQAVLQTLDKVTGRTETRTVKVGETLQFGPLYGVIQTCRESPPIEEPESAVFIQVWEPILSADQSDIAKADTRWVFSGWMFASSPALSAMDHPIYDIWVLDCVESQGEKATEEQSNE